MGFIIGSARVDEKGNYKNGSAGDQTGKEVSTQSYYAHKKGWYCLRAKSASHANALAKKMQEACGNANIGYDQNNRLGIIKYGIATATKTECDCSSLVRQCIIEATGKDPGNFTTANECDKLMATGLFQSKFAVSSESQLYDGDILVTKTKGHTVIVTSGRARSVDEVGTKTNVNQTIKLGQQHSVNFTGHSISIDGIRGKETKKQEIRVLQRALNADYHKGIDEDGVYGSETNNALCKHYVKKGETQYLVTALEIICMMRGVDPQGVESPGTYGSGLTSALGDDYMSASDIKNFLGIS